MSTSTLKRHSIYMLALSMGSCAACLLTAPASAQSIQESMRLAIEHHPQVEQALAAMGASDGQVSSARSGFFPEINLNATGGRVYQNNATSRGLTVTRGSAYSGFGEGSASLRQIIFDGNKTLNRFRAAKNDAASSQYQLEAVRDNLAYNTALSYITILQSREILAKLDAHKQAMLEDYDRISVMVDEGAADNAQLQQARSVVSLLEMFETDYRDQLAREEASYEELTGIPPYHDMSAPDVFYDWLPQTSAAAITMALHDHPALRAAKEDAKSSFRNISAVRGELYPDLFGELSYLKQDKLEEIGGELTDARAVLKMSWQFDAGGAQFADIKSSKHEHEQAVAREKEVKRQIERDIRLAYAQKVTAKRRLVEQAEQVDLNKKLYKTYQTQFQGGTVTLLQLMQAQDQLFSSEVQNIAYRYQDFAADLGIMASIGRVQHTMFNGAPIGVNEQASVDEAFLDGDISDDVIQVTE